MRTLTESLRFQNDADYRNFLQRLQTFKPYMEQTIALLKQGVARGMTEPQVVMTRVPHQIAAYVVADPAASPFYEPFEKMPDIIPAAEQARLRTAAKAAIAGEVTPAYRTDSTTTMTICRTAAKPAQRRRCPMARPITHSRCGSTPPPT